MSYKLTNADVWEMVGFFGFFGGLLGYGLGGTAPAACLGIVAGGVIVSGLAIRMLSTERDEGESMQKYMNLLGKKVRDRVTRFEGVVTSVGFDLYGCVQVVVMPGLNDKDGKPGDGMWFDWKQLDVLDHTPVMAPPAYEEPGKEIEAAEKPPLR